MKEEPECYLPVLLVNAVVETEDGEEGREARRRQSFQQQTNVLDGWFENTPFIKHGQII